MAVVSVHTSPLDQPGTGDSGGMNVYIRTVAEHLAAQGVQVDLFTRCRGHDDPEVRGEGTGTRSAGCGPKRFTISCRSRPSSSSIT